MSSVAVMRAKSLSGCNAVFRTETLWITAFLAIGAVGGLVYNWPDSVVADPEMAPEATPASLAEASLDPAPIDATVAEQTPLRENPQVADQPLHADSVTQQNDTAGQQEEEGGIWSAISPPSKRSQPIDVNVLKLGDNYLTGGNSIGAYQHYTKLWQRASLPVDSSVLIRLGLSAEQAGLLAESAKHYRNAIRVSKRGSIQQVLSLLGTARVWELEGQLNDAIALLSELFLLYNHEDYPNIVRQLIIRQLADCLQKRLIQTNLVATALADEPMQYHWCPLEIYPILEAADFKPPAEPEGNPGTGLKLLQNPRGDASLILVEAQLDGVSVLKLLADISQLSGIRLDVTERAKSALVGRLANVDSPAISVSLLLDQVLEPLELSWSQSDDSIAVMAHTELTERDAASYDLARTQRMQRQVQLNFPNGVVRTASIMNEGNNARLSGGWELANEKYRAAREANPLGELNAKLFFNEASLGLVRDEKLNALHACYMTLDQTLSTELQANVYSMIAELELEFGQPAKAITAASRGIRRAEDPQLITRSAMTLARAYLLSGDPFSANSVLFDASADLTGERNKRLASVFGTYARYQHVKPKHGLQDEGQRLLMALSALDPNDVQTFADALIVSDAFTSVGLRSKAIDSLQVALDIAPPGYWNDKIRLQLARMYYDATSLELANATVESFGSVSADLLPTILLLHASIQLDMGNLEACESICRRILAMDTDKELQADTLNKLGETLQRSGQHYAAALCFAGLLPEPEAVDAESGGDAEAAQ